MGQRSRYNSVDNFVILRVAIFSHICNNVVLYILYYLVIANVDLDFACVLYCHSFTCVDLFLLNLCMCILVQWSTHILDIKFIISFLGFNIRMSLQIILLNFLGGPHYWGCSFSTLVGALPVVLYEWSLFAASQVYTWY